MEIDSQDFFLETLSIGTSELLHDHCDRHLSILMIDVTIQDVAILIFS